MEAIQPTPDFPTVDVHAALQQNEAYRKSSTLTKVRAWGLQYQRAVNELLTQYVPSDRKFVEMATFAITDLKQQLAKQGLPTPDKGIGYRLVNGEGFVLSYHWSRKQTKMLEAEHQAPAA